MKDKEKQSVSMKEMLTKRSFETITNCNCRQNKDGAFADLLNNEIEELQKAMDIVEMQNVVCKRLCNQDCRLCNYYNKNDCIQKDNVDALYEQGYRKTTDSVVLSREEYERLKHYEWRVTSGVCMTQKEWFDFCNEDSNRRTCLRIEERERERKETAEKILKDIMLLIPNEIEIIKRYFKQILGIEIKE